METVELSELSDKIEKGIQLAAKRLREKTKREGGELVFSKGGKIIHIQAKDLK